MSSIEQSPTFSSQQPVHVRSGRRLRIGFVHRYDARDIRSWSGIFFFMAKALEAHVGEVVYLGPDTSRGTQWIINGVSRFNHVSHRISGKNLMTDHNRWLSGRLGRFFARRLKESPCDVLFAPVASVEIARLKTDLPIVYLTDIPWAAIVGYYPEFSSITKLGKAEGERMEAWAMGKATASVYPSQWALDCARKHYGAKMERSFQVSFGANLLDPPTREVALARRLRGPVNLLMVAVDWERKGGPIAFDCLKALLARGIDAQLTVVGCVPPAEFKSARMTVIPFLDKHRPEQRKRLDELFVQAHFLLLPTRAEGLGVVTCEASAFGLPTLGTDTGGVSGALSDGVNGFLMPVNANGRKYADKIACLVAHPEIYFELVVSSRDEWERFLNWDAWGQSMKPVIRSVLGERFAGVGWETADDSGEIEQRAVVASGR